MSAFQWEDYLVFAVMLILSSAIGLYFGFRARYRNTDVSSDELLTGSRNLPMLPVALSLSASFTSATTILGIPAEVYTRGGEQWLWVFGLIPCFLIIGFFMLPIIYKLELTNAYEYLELRFCKPIRWIGSVLFSIIILTYMAAVLYAPSVALSQVTGLSSEISIVLIGSICTVYTSVGGIRGVVWTDAFQLVIVWVGLLALMFKGADDVGGWSEVWTISNTGSRLPKFDMDPDPFVRHTFWTLLIGGGLNMMTVYGANQTNLQRYSSVRTLRESQWALLLCLPLWIFYLTILCLLGLVMYANFVVCDPLTSGKVGKGDQLIPYFVLKVMGAKPGLPGLFIASIFSASISTLSSGINSLGAVTLEDVLKPLYAKLNDGKQLPKKTSTIATMMSVVFFGGLTMGLAYLANLLGKTALSISFGVFGMVGGPLLGLFINGMFVPFINKWGAFSGLISSLVICLWIGIYPVIHPPPKNYLPLTKCADKDDAMVSSNITTTMASIMSTSTTNTTTALPPSDNDGLYISYIHYTTVAILISFVVACVMSAVTGFNKGEVVDERTYYKYSWCCSSNESSSSYDLKMAGKRNENFKEPANSECPMISSVSDEDLYRPTATNTYSGALV